jgi:hypothetical protein
VLGQGVGGQDLQQGDEPDAALPLQRKPPELIDLAWSLLVGLVVGSAGGVGV